MATSASYEWNFVEPRTSMELMIEIYQPLSSKDFVVLAEFSEDVEGIEFSWTYSKVLRGPFCYIQEALAPSYIKLPRLAASSPIERLGLTVLPWKQKTKDVRSYIGECWLSSPLSDTRAYIQPAMTVELAERTES